MNRVVEEGAAAQTPRGGSTPFRMGKSWELSHRPGGQSAVPARAAEENNCYSEEDSSGNQEEQEEDEEHAGEQDEEDEEDEEMDQE